MALPLQLTTTFLPPFRSGGAGGGKMTSAPAKRVTPHCSIMRDFIYRSHQLLRSTLSHSAVSVTSSAAADGSLRRQGSGVFIDDSLVLTAANLVGDFTSTEKTQLVDAAVVGTRDGKKLIATPVAVSFDSGLAVVKLAAPLPPPLLHQKMPFPYYSVGDFLPAKYDLLMVLLPYPKVDEKFVHLVGTVRSSGGNKTIKVEAPRPLKNDLVWIEFDFFQFFQFLDSGRDDFPLRNLGSSKDHIFTGSFSRMLNGSPIFNGQGQLVGLGSWEVRGQGIDEPVSFAASISLVKRVVDYAIEKHPDDPIVMDSCVGAWIER